MNLDIKAELKLTDKEVSQIIKEYLESKEYQVVGDVVFNVSTQIEGYGIGEHEVTRFRGVTVKVNMK